jgi:hypothetical protein
MKKTSTSLVHLFALVAFFPAIGFSAGCDNQLAQDENPLALNSTEDGTESRKRHDMASPGHDMAHGGDPDMGGGGFPTANPPPSSCDQRNSGVTGLQVVVRIDEYQGLITGRNGTHEIAYGTVIDTPWVYDSAIVDTSNVQLAMNVASAKDSTGLPSEIRLTPGETLEVEGEYIPASTANAHDAKGAAAVIHYSHAPCGYVNIGGTVYK